MSGRRRILFGAARAMISDDAIVSGLVVALLRGLVVAAMLPGSPIGNCGGHCDCWRLLDVEK